VIGGVDWCSPALGGVDWCSPALGGVDWCSPEIGGVDWCSPEIGGVDWGDGVPKGEEGEEEKELELDEVDLGSEGLAAMGMGALRGISMWGLGGEEENWLLGSARGWTKVGVELRVVISIAAGLGGEEENILNRGAEDGFDEEWENILPNVGVEGRAGLVICGADDCLVKGGARVELEVVEGAVGDVGGEDDELGELLVACVAVLSSVSCFNSFCGSWYSATCTAFPNIYSCSKKL
jgi:hypothetical protein